MIALCGGLKENLERSIMPEAARLHAVPVTRRRAQGASSALYVALTRAADFPESVFCAIFSAVNRETPVIGVSKRV